MKTTFPAALPHGAFTEIFPEIFTVTGGFKFAPGLSIGRNMTVIRQGRDLALVNSVRLTPEGEAELDKLGTVKHLLRIGEFHGADDPYYVDRYKPTYWAPSKMGAVGGLKADRALAEGASPIEGSRVFSFDGGRKSEVSLVLDREGGVLVTCDAYQHWTSFDDCSLLGGVMMRTMGFGPTHIGSPWTKAMGQGVRPDFDRLLDVQFSHLVPAHGSVLRNGAKDGLRTAIAKRFPR